MTIKEQIDSRIETILAGIRIVNGFQTDAGANVFKNLEYTERPDVIPCIAWFPGEMSSGADGDTPPSLGEENHFYPVTVEGYIADDKRGTSGEQLRTDIVRALRADNTLGGLAEQIQEVKSSLAVQEGDEVFSLVQVSFTIFYVTPWGGL